MRLVIAALFLLPTLAAAQSPVTLELRDPAPIAGPPAYSVARVLDLRADTTTVGEAKVGLFNRLRGVVLEGGTIPAVTAYLTGALPAGDGREPLVVGVDVLRVSEQTTAVREFGRAEVHLRFFSETSDGLTEIGGGQALVEGTGMDVTAAHDDRLADALDEALRQFLQTGPVDPATASEPIAEADLVARPPSTVSLTEPAERSIRTFISGGPILGANAVGGRLGYGVRPVQAGDWLLPVAFEVAVLRTENPDTGSEGTFSTYGGSIQAARRLGHSNVFVQPGLQISGGTEQLSSDGTGFFLGGRLSLDVIRYPADRGIVVGAGVYGTRLFGSDLYPRDVGFSLTLGGQF